MSQYWWVALAVLIVALAYEKSAKLGGWFLFFIVLSMLYAAKEKGLI